MRDAVVINNLHQRNFDFSNVEEMLRYEAVERQPRVWDKAPKRLSLKKAKDLPVFGCRNEFIIAYQALIDETRGDLFRLDLGQTQRICDKEIYVVLQVLVKNGICYNLELSNACYDLFRIICTAPVDTLTVERVYQQLQGVKSGNYWEEQVLTAIKECLFGDNPVSLYWNSIAQFTGLYKECYEKGRDVVIEKCATEKEVDAFVRENHKLAKADKEFMKSTYTEGISKPMIAMLYYLRETNPEVLRIGDSGEGW